MTELLKKAIGDYRMLKGVRHVIVALSGGADSVALLYSLLEIKDEYGICVSAAHLNHSLRGEESVRDMQFCKELCQDLGVDIVIKTEDVGEYAKSSKQSIELSARQKRYAFFNKLCSENTVIATAHTASDNLETMLINLARGTAIKGLCGIPPVRDIFIRPLIYCKRQDIEDYCSTNNLCYVTDSTNLSDDYTRNVIRHKVVPVLKSINRSIESSTAKTAKALRDDSDYIDSKALELFKRAYADGLLDVRLIHDSHPAVLSRVVAMYASAFSVEISNALITKICSKLKEDFPKFSVEKGIYCRCVGSKLEFIDETKKSEDISYSVQIERVLIKDLQKSHKINSLLLKNAFDYDKIAGKPILRTRLEGDKIKLSGRPEKSLKKLYNECKIPIHSREGLPVIADDNGVIWIYGIGVAERVKVSSGTENVGVIRI